MSKTSSSTPTRVRSWAVQLGALVFLLFSVTTPAAASPVYAEARLDGVVRQDGTAGMQQTPFDVGGVNATTAQVNEALPESQATGTMGIAARHVAISTGATSSHTSHTWYDAWNQPYNVIDSQATGMTSLTAQFSSTYQIGSATLAAGTPVTVDLLWNLLGSVSQSYGYAGIHVDTSGKTGALGGGSPNLYSFNHLQDWAVGQTHDGTNRIFGDPAGGSATIDASFTGSESLKVGDIFTIGANFDELLYSSIHSEIIPPSTTWRTYTDGWGTANLTADLNLSSADNVVFTPLAVPEPASLLLIGTGLIGLAGLRQRNSRTE
ncbi:MAG: PEP-CTERM sorting domain-containing protein [Deltaproteobacteria bacterium]|nr:PEP-CTERM sorting domain-containing protein [Deltaproteobacteria bacterium]